MSVRFTNNLNAGVNLDLDNLRLPPNAAVFIKNLTNNVNLNSGSPSGGGSNEAIFSPLEGNLGLTMAALPSGVNFTCGFYSSEATNEGYFAVYNSAGNHTIWVIDGDTGSVTLVHENTLLPFVLDPQYFYTDGRMTLVTRVFTDPVTNEETQFKLLVFTNNNKYQCVIDVAASIATNSYTTSYFTATSAYYNPLELIHLGVALPVKAIGLNTPNAYAPMDDTGVIDTASIDAPGTGYAIGDASTINGGSPLTTIIITAIGGGGAVVSFRQVIPPGNGYATATGIATTNVTGTGSGLTVNILSLIIPDISKQNLLINQGYQFRVRTWDIWGRPSNWGIISNVYTSIIGGGCFSTTNSLPRCVDLNFDAGNPLVKFIDVAYRVGVGNDPTGEVESGWYITETFSKYNDTTGVEWYNRPYNPLFTTTNSGIIFDPGINQITYTFCADKQSNPVDPTDAANTEPGLPISSSSVFSLAQVLGLANNSYDFNIPSQNVTNSIQFSVANTGSGAICPPAPLTTIILYAVIWNPIIDGGRIGHCRISNKLFVWGDSDGNCSGTDSISVDQVFADQDNPGFIAYLAGTPFSCVGVQGTLNPTTGIFAPYSAPNGFNFTSPSSQAVIQFVFNDVPNGRYVARLASHKALASQGNLQQTSTYVGGICVVGDLVSFTLNNYSANPLKEIYVDSTSGSVNYNSITSNIFVILDLSGAIACDGYLYEQNGFNVPVEMAPIWFGSSETADPYGSFFTDHNGFYFAASNSNILEVIPFLDFCDGNGPYWQTVYGPSNSIYSPILGLGNSPNGPGSGIGTGSGIVHGDGSGMSGSTCVNVQGNWLNCIFFLPTTGTTSYTTFPAAARRTITQTIYVCDTSNSGVPGVTAVWTNGPFGQTDNSGNVTLISHNRYNYLNSLLGVPHPFVLGHPFLSGSIPDYTTTPYSTEYLILSQKGSGCQWNVCSTCNTAISPIEILYIACCPIPPLTCTRGTILTTLYLQPNGFGIKGVQTGGKYPVAYWLHDVIGRHTAPQIRQGDAGYVFVPNLTDYQSMSLRSLQVTIPAGLIVDPSFTKVTFLVGANALFSDLFSWQADWVQYVNNAGNPDNANPTAIRIYLNSLNEYNKLYNFKTNVAWDFIATSQVPGTPADICQFIMNGNGAWLPPQKGIPVSYDQYGTFFTVPFSPELAGLQNGCLFRIVRPKQNTTNTNLPYYEQALTLNITNGQLPAGTYILPYQDSYLLARTIPVPLFKNNSNPISPGAQPQSALQLTSTNQTTALDTGGYSTNNASNSNNVIIVQPVDYPTSFPFFFESPSPSDLWGSHLYSSGRVGVPNVYEQQQRNGNEIALSQNISNIGFENGMSIFLDTAKYSFDRNTWGDITVVLTQTSVVLVICEKDHFVLQYNKTNLIVTSAGVQAQNQQGPFTTPERKAGTNYGCPPGLINTIKVYAGIVRWLDPSGYLVAHNFSEANSMSDQLGYKGYLLNKIGAVNQQNLSSATLTKYFIGGIDPKNMEYLLTTFYYDTSRVSPLPPSYLNTQSQPDLSVNETLIFDLYTTRLKSFASFTPEFYGLIPSYFSQRQFLSFKNGIPYIHHGNAVVATPPPYANFYGVQCEVRVTHVVNGIDDEKGAILSDAVKRFLYSEIYCRQNIPGVRGASTPLFYYDTITTEKGQVSRVALGLFSARDGYFCAAYLCDLDTPYDPNNPATGATVLYDGDNLQGLWMQVSMTTNPAYTGSYFSLRGIVNGFNVVGKSGR